MKTHDTTSDNDYKSHAAANDRQTKSGPEKNGLASPGPTAQRKHTDIINGSPYMVSQRKRLRGISGQALQKQGASEEEELTQGKSAAQRQPSEDEELMQGKFTTQMQLEEDEELMQGKFTAQMQPDDNRTGMPDDLKASMETTLNTDFSQVRIHSNSTKAKEVGALAYTQGTDVHFAPGQFKPETSTGQQLLGHELAHVVQQAQGRVKPIGEMAGLPVNDSPDLENEADRLAEKFSQ